MKIIRINIGGNREEIDKKTKKHTPNLIDNVKRSDLIFTPERLIKKLFKGTHKEYDSWLMKHKLHPSQINYQDINQKNELLKKLKVYTLRLLDEAKTDSMFANELGNIIITKWLDSFDTLENHIYDLSVFNYVDFIKVTESFKKNFTTNSPFAFLTIDDTNQQIKVIESHKVLLILEKPLPMGNKRGTPLGHEPKKLYQNFFTTIGYKGKGELTEGLNHHRTNFKNFNFNLNIELQLLNDIIYDVLKYEKEKIQVAFTFGAYGKKLYFESDIKGIERKKEELQALAIVENGITNIKKKLHKERQGSIAVDKTTIEVQKRIEHPKVYKKSIISSNIQTSSIDVEKENQPIKNFQQKEKLEKILIEDVFETLDKHEKEIFIRQQAYAELAKEKVNEALTNRNQYIIEFHSFLKKGMGVTDALNKFSERYAKNPYIKGIIETAIAGELQLQNLKDKGIEELKYHLTILKNDIQRLKKDLGTKETELATMSQEMESLITAHIKQLEKIEEKISELIIEKEVLIKNNNQQSEMIEELEKLISEYESNLQKKNQEVNKKDSIILELHQSLETYKKEYNNSLETLEKEKNVLLETNIEQSKKLISLGKVSKEVEELKYDKQNLFRKLENSNLEIKHYLRQIEQLKEENQITLSTTNLLKINNTELTIQLENLKQRGEE
jgi:hypothetical protein